MDEMNPAYEFPCIPFIKEPNDVAFVRTFETHHGMRHLLDMRRGLYSPRDKLHLLMEAAVAALASIRDNHTLKLERALRILHFLCDRYPRARLHCEWTSDFDPPKFAFNAPTPPPLAPPTGVESSLLTFLVSLESPPFRDLSYRRYGEPFVEDKRGKWAQDRLDEHIASLVARVQPSQSWDVQRALEWATRRRMPRCVAALAEHHGTVFPSDGLVELVRFSVSRPSLLPRVLRALPPRCLPDAFRLIASNRERDQTVLCLGTSLGRVLCGGGPEELFERARYALHTLNGARNLGGGSLDDLVRLLVGTIGLDVHQRADEHTNGDGTPWVWPWRTARECFEFLIGVVLSCKEPNPNEKPPAQPDLARPIEHLDAHVKALTTQARALALPLRALPPSVPLLLANQLWDAEVYVTQVEFSTWRARARVVLLGGRRPQHCGRTWARLDLSLLAAILRYSRPRKARSYRDLINLSLSSAAA